MPGTEASPFEKKDTNVLNTIHKHLRQFRYSYWWRARHVGMYKPLFMTGKKC